MPVHIYLHPRHQVHIWDDWEEDKHLRKPAGSAGGGQFTSGGTGGAVAKHGEAKSTWSPEQATKAQRVAIRHYTENGYKFINAALRKGGGVDPATRHTIQELDGILEASSHAGPVYRGIGPSALKKLEKAGLLEPGKVFFDMGFSSFSSSRGFARQWSKGVLPWSQGAVIVCSKGGNGFADISQLSILPQEREVLLRREQRMVVKFWDRKTRTLEVELHGQEEKPAEPNSKPILPLSKPSTKDTKRKTLFERMGEDDWSGVKFIRPDGTEGTL
jgi:hypothetical protein